MDRNSHPQQHELRKEEQRGALGLWQKLAALVSALWLIGLPVYLMADSNRRANEFYTWCVTVESKIASDMASPEVVETPEQQQEKCRRAARFMTPTVLAQTLVVGNADTWTLWTLMLGPVVALWFITASIYMLLQWLRIARQ
jgi:hypothetical protein